MGVSEIVDLIAGKGLAIVFSALVIGIILWLIPKAVARMGRMADKHEAFLDATSVTQSRLADVLERVDSKVDEHGKKLDKHSEILSVHSEYLQRMHRRLLQDSDTPPGSKIKRRPESDSELKQRLVYEKDIRERDAGSSIH